MQYSNELTEHCLVLSLELQHTHEPRRPASMLDDDSQTATPFDKGHAGCNTNREDLPQI